MRDVPEAHIAAISSYLPRRVLSNEMLGAIYPEWPADRIYQKTGILKRHIAAENETASDMAIEAAKKLFFTGVDRASIDYLIFCTQAPDYILPTSACLIQAKLDLPKSIGALDINLGCSGYVYGLSLAKGIVASGAAKNVLLLTADTYSKFIHPMDKSVRTLFGDAATATLISAKSGGCINEFVFGTDGRGADKLIVEAGLCRVPKSEATATEKTDASGNVRSRESLFMDGAEVMAFSLREVPLAVQQTLDRNGLHDGDVAYYVMHQANQFMLTALRKKLGCSPEKMPFLAENEGNTVSSTIPLALEKLLKLDALGPGKTIVLVGFGVGYSWAGCSISF